MRALIVEDDFASREILQKILSTYGECRTARNGQEAIDAYRQAWDKSQPYDLICMDIMMPGLDGQEALRRIRQIEKELGIGSDQESKVIMVSALDDSQEVIDALYKGSASAYFVKPIQIDAFIQELKVLGLIEN